MTVWTIVAAVVGAVVVGVLLMLRRDVHRAARTGPQWRRAIIAAGILALTAVGISSLSGCVTCYEPVPQAIMPRQGFIDELGQLNRQLPLLEKLVAAERLDHAAARQTLLECERRVYWLESEFAYKKLSKREYGEAQSACGRARVSLRALRLKVGYDERAFRYFGWNSVLEQEHRLRQADNAATQPARGVQP
ncbi:MAG: hypothetical protein LLG03_05315 [Planctomycetaceae bacterium]|nr:hypothetical protein [Planctomycetaceae bacterium]